MLLMMVMATTGRRAPWSVMIECAGWMIEWHACSSYRNKYLLVVWVDCGRFCGVMCEANVLVLRSPVSSPSCSHGLRPKTITIQPETGEITGRVHRIPHRGQREYFCVACGYHDMYSWPQVIWASSFLLLQIKKRKLYVMNTWGAFDYRV